MSSRSSHGGANLESSLFVAIMQVADVLGSAAEQVVKGARLTSAQYNVLRILRGAGREGLACREIGERMISRDPDITRLLDRMEKHELITRERQSDDRRVVKTFVTAAGLQLLKTLDQPVRELHKKQFERLNAKQLSVLAGLLRDLNADRTGICEESKSKAKRPVSGKPE